MVKLCILLLQFFPDCAYGKLLPLTFYWTNPIAICFYPFVMQTLKLQYQDFIGEASCVLSEVFIFVQCPIVSIIGCVL